jgi:hypothetical protein
MGDFLLHWVRQTLQNASRFIIFAQGGSNALRVSKADGALNAYCETACANAFAQAG